MTAQDLLAVRDLIAVAHHIPGRIRLKFDMAIRHHPAYDAVRCGAVGLPGIRTARLNPMAGSMTIEYDTGRLPFHAVQALFTTMDEVGVKTLLDELGCPMVDHN